MAINNFVASSAFEQFAENETTVQFLPDMNAGAMWVGMETVNSLRAAVEMVIADNGQHDGYQVIIHEPDNDIVVSLEQLQALIAELN